MKTFALIDQKRINKVEDDWLTPPGLIQLLGPFDLDPCASPGQPWPTAKKMIVLPENGLTAKWEGFAFCNPPYGRALKPWTKRMAEHNNGILLVPAATEMSWFKPIWLGAKGIFFIYDRVMFYHPAKSGPEKAGTLCPNKWRPHVLAGFGDRAEEKLARLKIPGSYVEGWSNSDGSQSFYNGDDKKLKEKKS